jgi:hypothetical protein
MADEVLEASAASFYFSVAINSEITHDDEQIAPPTPVNDFHEASNTVSEALIAEIERNVENGTMCRSDLEHKCERFAAILGDYKANDGEKFKSALIA